LGPQVESPNNPRTTTSLSRRRFFTAGGAFSGDSKDLTSPEPTVSSRGDRKTVTGAENVVTNVMTRFPRSPSYKGPQKRTIHDFPRANPACTISCARDPILCARPSRRRGLGSIGCSAQHTHLTRLQGLVCLRSSRHPGKFQGSVMSGASHSSQAQEATASEILGRLEGGLPSSVPRASG
jgi:hypothetical protein